MSTDNLESRVSQAVKREFDNLSIQAQQTGFVGKVTALKVTRSLIGNVMLALRGMVEIDDSLTQPCWLGEPCEWDARDVFIAKNGIIHLPSLADGRDFLMEHTRDFFGFHAVDYEVLSQDTPIEGWRGFLNSIWGNDPQGIELLQDWLGYCLTSDTRQQKILLMYGPPRSGKGTIASILTELVGRPNVVTPTLASLSQNFGLQPWIDKSVAIFSDARLEGRMAKSVITERLLSISGGDSLTIDVKYGQPITTVLQTRIMILTNELFQLRDASGALANRILILPMTESFLGKEDIFLKEELKKELPGILRWAVEGWVRLRKRGHFVEPASSKELRNDLMGLSSPVKAFLDDCCVIAPTAFVGCGQLYRTFCEWANEQGHNYVPTVEMFGRDLVAIVPGLHRFQERNDEKRVWMYRGVAHRP
jgi:putative DNA primase/helicase